MDKKIIDGLLKNQKVKRPWSEQEINNLTELKKAGVTLSTILRSLDIRKTYFSNRTDAAIKDKYIQM